MENVLENNEIGDGPVSGEALDSLVLEGSRSDVAGSGRVDCALHAMAELVSGGSLGDEERGKVVAGIRDTAGLSSSPAATEIAADVLAKLLPDEGVVVLPELSRVNGGWAYRAVKRAFDVVSCSCALVLLSPVMAYVAARIKLESPGPVLYAQVREGVGGRPFKLYKFRSMYTDAEARGAQWAAGDDPRITPFGRFLRKSRLDEVPQFWNVVRGDMSLGARAPSARCSAASSRGASRGGAAAPRCAPASRASPRSRAATSCSPRRRPPSTSATSRPARSGST